jgi:hypothetical protein
MSDIVIRHSRGMISVDADVPPTLSSINFVKGTVFFRDLVDRYGEAEANRIVERRASDRSSKIDQAKKEVGK